MACPDRLDEMSFGFIDVFQGLTRLRRMTERDEVSRVAGSQAFANFRILLEAADTRAVATAGVNDDGRPTVVVDLLRGPGKDAQQRVVDRVGQLRAVDQQLVVEFEQERVTGALVPQGVVPALAQRIPEQKASLAQVGEIFLPLIERRLVQ
ncbi:hypothetical protein D3C81_1758980 [compost metagenome]